MREVRQAGSDPSFLLKALSEGSGELRRALYGLGRRELLAPGENPDDGWTLLAIPYHLLQVERGILGQYHAILGGMGRGELEHVDLDDIPFEDDYRNEDDEFLLDEFHHLRRKTSYLLWDLMPSEWERSGEHPYRGPMTVLEITREVYQHDLEHLWQARRMLASLAGSRR